MKQRISILAIIAICVLSCFATMVNTFREHDGGFTRRIVPIQFDVAGVEKISNARIAGVTTDTLIYFYCGNPHRLLLAGPDMKRTDSIYLRFDTAKTNTVNLAYSIDLKDSIAMLSSSNLACMFFYNLRDGDSNSVHFHEKYNVAVPVSSHSYILRAFDSSMRNQYFVKENTQTGTLVKEQSLSAQSNDAGINEDGMLLFDTIKCRAIYVHYYNNEILVLDTNLSVTGLWHTIDTFNHVRIHTAHNKKAISNDAPTRVTNRHSFLSGGMLYILSKVKADNEKFSDFKEHAVIDMYNLSDGSYSGSFYIPTKDGKQPFDFALRNGICVVSYPDYLVSYHVSGL